MSIFFVTNFCPHYRVRTFELLHRRLGAEFLFFSRGDETYWPSRFGVRTGDFPHRYLTGFTVAGTRVTPSLPLRLLLGGCEPVIKCINGRFALPVSYLAARLRGRPFVLWTGIWHHLGSRFHRWFRPVSRWICRHADAVVVYGSHVEDFLIAEGVAAEDIFVAPHATDAARYRPPVGIEARAAVRRRFDIPAGVPLALFVGRLTEEKGVDVLLEAFARRPSRVGHLLMVGDGRARQRLEATAEKLGLKNRIHFAGPVSPDEISPYYAAADLLVLPSITTAHFREPWGLVVNEAFHQARPVVASDAVGAAVGGLVCDGETGRVVPEGDAEALADALADLMAHHERRSEMGMAAHRRVLDWSNEAMVEGFALAVAHARSRRRGRKGKA